MFDSNIFFNGEALFQFNVANAYAPLDDDESSIQSQGGAISACSSALIFENTSSTIFRENNFTHLRGAISISKGTTLTIRRGARSIFHKNCAYHIGGGAIYE